MSVENQANLTVEQAQKILGEFSCTETKTVSSEEEKALLREALLLFTRLSDSQNFGICADTAAEGFFALETYLKALGYDVSLDPPDFTSTVEPVYIKYNTLKGSYYFDSYTGSYRGVLVSCQSSQAESVNGTYGHLPLDLFI
jgi:Domain of unknown function (DUF1824)